MTLAGVFNPAARAAIYTAGLDRCAGCGRPADSAQHRRARGMGGTSDVTIGHPANGVPDSPPLARGARGREAEAVGVHGLTPACAGSTPPQPGKRLCRRTHPRLRGEHPL